MGASAGITNFLKRYREDAGLSQQALADRAGLSRQSLSAIEAGRSVPSTLVALQLAQALGCAVEDLFRLAARALVSATLATSGERSATPDRRVRLGRVQSRWVAHALEPGATAGADGIVDGEPRRGGVVRVKPLADRERLACNVLVAGCAPALGLLSARVGSRYRDARPSWVHAGSSRALDMLAEGLVHVAGSHLHDERSGEDNVPFVRERFAGQSMLVVNLVRWRQGLIVAPGNPLGLHAVADLLRGEGAAPRLARREAGAGASKLLRRHLDAAGGAGVALPDGPLAGGHMEVARAVASGAADVGVAIESAALAFGLDFVPLAEERFDLVVRAAVAAEPHVARVLDALDRAEMRDELVALGGYDASATGHAISLGASC